MKLLMKYITRNLSENMGRTILIMMSLFVVSIVVSVVTLAILFFGMINDTMSNAFSYEYSMGSNTDDYLQAKVFEKIKEDFDVLGISDLEYGYIINDEGEFNSVPLFGLDIQKSMEFNLLKIRK